MFVLYCTVPLYHYQERVSRTVHFIRLDTYSWSVVVVLLATADHGHGTVTLVQRTAVLFEVLTIQALAHDTIRHKLAVT